MDNNRRPFRSEQDEREQQQQEKTGLENINTRINRSADDLDEKSSTVSKHDRNRSGLSTKDGLTGSDLDGQVTRP